MFSTKRFGLRIFQLNGLLFELAYSFGSSGPSDRTYQLPSAPSNSEGSVSVPVQTQVSVMVFADLIVQLILSKS